MGSNPAFGTGVSQKSEDPAERGDSPLAHKKTMINFDDFNKLDIRIGTILEAETVPETDKLLKLTVNLGPLNTSGQQELRTLVAGIGDVYQPEELKGKQIPILTNLEPKTIKGIESKGMILAVDIDNKAVLLHPDKTVADGSKIR